jgi:tellurite methyltransferase
MSESRRQDWNDRFSRGETENKPPEALLVSAAASIPPGTALDLACGLGRNSLYLAGLGWDVTAVDYSDVALAKLRERGSSVTAVRADLERGEFEIDPGRYDLILDCCFLHRPLFPLIRRGVRAGGLFVGVLPVNDPEAATPMNPAFLVEPGELFELFSDWHIEHWAEERRGGDPSRRLRAQLIARKPV